MYLRSLYSDPPGLFSRVDFRDGINYIFGKKDTQRDSKLSLNGIGKSTLLDLLDFCLLASYTKNHNPRLYNARGLLLGHQIVLEFEIDKKVFAIKRSVETSEKVLFGPIGSLSEFKVKDLQKTLTDMVFKDGKYAGKLQSNWWRRLILFFLKIQKHKKEQFQDPIEYIRQSSVAELNQYHLYLLGLDNSLAVENHRVITNLKLKEPLIREIKKLLQESYEVPSIKDAQNTINSLRRDISQLEVGTKRFALATQYYDAESRANALTARIKSLWFQNHQDRKTIDSYDSSIRMEDGLTDSEIAAVKRLYGELRKDFAEKVSKTLREATQFRMRLRESRLDFLNDEIAKLRHKIDVRESEISEAESERSRLFEFLSAQEAIKDLTEAFADLAEKRRVLGDLEAKLKTYNDLEFERLDLEKNSKQLEIEVKKFIASVSESRIPALANVFAEVYNAIYPKAKGPLFAITEQLNSDAKLQIAIEFPAMMSKGKNQGRTLVYDLAVLFSAIRENRATPRFLVHDGIFDGMDKAHLAHLHRYLEEQKTLNRFQYIVTLNEEGTLSTNFGPADEITPEKIADDAILVLTPTKKLLGTDF